MVISFFKQNLPRRYFYSLIWSSFMGFSLLGLAIFKMVQDEPLSWGNILLAPFGVLIIYGAFIGAIVYVLSTKFEAADRLDIAIESRNSS